MGKIKCSCGEQNCTTTIDVEISPFLIGVAIEHSNAGSNRLDISLDANGAVELIKRLKQALNDMI